MAVNYMGPMYLILACLPIMLVQKSGYIINISSAAGKLAPPRESVYAGSKFAITGLTEGLALDLHGTGIHPAVIHVGPIETEIWNKLESSVRFSGKKYPPSVVSKAVFKCIEKKCYEATAPPFPLSLVFLMKNLFPSLVRNGMFNWDPIEPEILEEARQKALSKNT